MKKILIIVLLLFTGSIFAQPTTTITNPILKGTFKIGGSYIIDSTNKIGFSNPIFVTDYVQIGTGKIKDSTSNYITFNKAPVFNTAIKWLDGSIIKTGTITSQQISSGTISSGQLTTTLKDSLFSSSTVAGVNLLIEAERTRMNRLFSSTGNFKSTVLSSGFTVDTTLNTIIPNVDTASMKIVGGKIQSRMQNIFDFTTNSFTGGSVKIGDLEITDNSGTLNLSDSIATQQVAANTFLINWQNTSEVYELKIDADVVSNINFRAGDPATGDLNFYTGPGPSLKLDGAGNMYINFSNIRTQNVDNSLDLYNRWNFKDTVDFLGAVILNFSPSDLTITNTISFSSTFDGSVPGSTPTISPVGNFIGTIDGTYLSVPAKWVVITLDGNEYRIPAFAP